MHDHIRFGVQEQTIRSIYMHPRYFAEMIRLTVHENGRDRIGSGVRKHIFVWTTMTRISHFATATFFGLLLTDCLWHPAASGDDWSQFLGPNRNGTASESGLIDSFDDRSLKVVWRVPGGVGMSAVAVAGQYAVTMWNTDDQQLLVALDAKTGETRWATPLAPPYENSMGDGPRATPTIVGDVVYAYTGEGVLVAAKLESGEVLWQTDPVRENRVMPSEYGMSSSPLVVGERVIVHAGGSDSTVSAYDAKSGTRVWAAGSGPAGYSSPTLLEVDGVSHVVCFVGAGVLGLSPSDGKVLWSYPFKTPYDCNTATPIMIDGGVFVSAGENHGCVLLDVRKQGDNYDVSERWKSVETKSVMRNEWQTSVVLDGYLYGFDNVGSAGPTTHLSCIQATTGERIWQEARFGKGNVTLADGKLWITTMEGELVLAKASAESYQELGRVKLFGKTRQSLSIAGGHGYIRDDTNVLCIRLAK